ncbi:MAG: mechanosensitive ion channel [Schlesneria sp.]|nr:mechanosensitive ion channel [Schlesneria sp.]
MVGRRRIVSLGGVVFFAVLAVLNYAIAQSVEPADELTLADLQMRLKHAQSEIELAPKVKQTVIETYQSAIERFEIADEAAVAAKSYLQRMNTVAEDLQQAKLMLATLPDAPSLTVSATDDIVSLERQLTERRQQIDDPEHGLRATAETIKRQLASRKTRLEEITHELAEIDERLTSIQDALDASPPQDQPRELTAALDTLLTVRKLRATEERTALRSEQTWCESEVVNELLRTQRDMATKELALADAEVQLIQDAVDKRRGSEADQRVRAAELVVAQTKKPFKPIAETNLELAKESHDLTTELHDTNERLDAARDNYNTLKADFEQSQTMEKAVGLTESIGLLLRQQRAKISDTRSLHSRLALRGEKVRQTRMRLFQIETELTALQDLDDATTKTATELIGDESASPQSSVKTLDPAMIEKLAVEIRPLLEQRTELIERLNADYGTGFEKLVLLDNDERKLLDLTEKYAAYIDERVLWIRTGSIFGGSHVARAVANSTWLVDRANWSKVVDALQVNFQREPLPYAFALAGFLLWIATRWTLQSRLRKEGIAAADPSCRNMLPTLQAIVMTVLLAGFVPAALGFLSWRLDHCASISRFVHAVAFGLRRAAIFAASLELLRLMVARGGLCEKHFDWSMNSLIRLRRHLHWFVPVGIALVGIAGMIEATSDEQRLDTLGRVDFLVFVGLLAFFSHRAFPRFEETRPDAAAVPPAVPQDPRRKQETEDEVWVHRLSRFGSFMTVAIPLGLLVLCWSGYFYTALQLTWRIQSSAWLVLALVLLRGTVRRWITLERRRMAVLQAQELQAIVGASKDPGADGHSPFLFPRWTWPDFRLNLTQIVTQVRSLLDTGLLTLAAIGLWFIWADVTPALNILDHAKLWKTTVEEVVISKDANEKDVVQIVKRPMDITVANLGLAALILSIAIIAGRNVPGLVEVILLEHLSVDAGVRFATTCLVRYVIFTSGVVLAFNEIGIGWNSMQWLVAAASVGLGFGLQEIFANFVSGIILLFERPMRVGDVITIGDTTGTVSRIRFRATTIVDGDRKELIVPNKSFITGNLLNWTLSDSVNRVAVKVGVAYGSDPDRVRELLLKIASEHPSILKDPAPTASLEELGDSALIFQMRAFLPTLKDRQKATHELNTMIHDRFRAAGIDIPFPQQEVTMNVRSMPPRSEPYTDLHGSLDAALKRAGVNV